MQTSASAQGNLTRQQIKTLAGVLMLVFIVVWWMPTLRPLHGLELMPLWLHTLMEAFAIVISIMIFGVIWNAHTRERSSNIVILACAFLATGLIDFAHTLSYRGMPDFITPAGPEKAINFWLAARLTLASALLAIAWRSWRTFAFEQSPQLLLGGFLAFTACIWWLGLFHQEAWPHTFIEGQGLTPLKVGVEYVIVAVMTLAATIIYVRRKHIPEANSLFLATFTTILSELCFTLYAGVTDYMNLLGHIYKFVAYYFFYRAVFVHCVREPFLRLSAEIEEHQRTTQALAHSERYNQALLTHLPAAVVVHGLDTAIRYANGEACRLLGVHPDAIRGIVATAATWRFLYDDGTTIPAADYPVNRVLTSKAPLYDYLVGIVRDATADPLWVQINAFPYLDDTGQIDEVVITFVDVTARKLARESLQRALTELDDLYQHAPCGYHSLDNAGRFLLINQTELNWLGYQREEIIGRNFTELLKPNSIAVFAANHLHITASGQAQDIEYEMIRKDGSTFAVLLSATAMCDAAGHFLMTRSTLTDITDRKQAEKKLKELNEQLDQRVVQRTRELEIANKELEAFSYSVSHDLRAPLRGIDGFSQILIQRYAGQLDDTGRDYLQRVRRASQRMGELIDDLLQLSRLSRGTLRRQVVDLSALATVLLEEMQRSAPERQVKIMIQPGLSTFGDPGLMRAMLDNLLGNAWKFTSRTKSASIEFGCALDADQPVYFVRDNGAGFDSNYSHKLFQVFQRLHGNDEFEGTGIGLATVSRIIRRHDGTVWAEGTPGRGASFYFTLPQRTTERDDSEMAPPEFNEGKTA